MKLILFDIDGTLIRGGGAGRRSIVASFEEVFGLSGVDEAVRGVTLNGRTDPLIIRDLARACGIPPSKLDDHFGLVFETYLRHLKELTRGAYRAEYCPGFPRLLDRLERLQGVTLGLLTGNIEAGARIKLEPLDLNRYFAEGGFGSDAEDRKTIAAEARRKFEVLAGHPIATENVLVVGDTIHDVACGRQNGFLTLAVGTGGVTLEELRGAGADLVFEDLKDVDSAVAAVQGLMGLAPSA